MKFANAHDLRPSIAERWATRVMPAVLQQRMWQENVQPTMR